MKGRFYEADNAEDVGSNGWPDCSSENERKRPNCRESDFHSLIDFQVDDHVLMHTRGVASRFCGSISG